MCRISHHVAIGAASLLSCALVAPATAHADPGTMLVAGLFASDFDLPGGEVSFFVGFPRVTTGVQLQASRTEGTVIQGIVRGEGLRLRARLPLSIKVASDDDVRLDALVAPGIRRVAAGDASALTATGELGFQGWLRITPRLAGHTAFVFPMAIDVDPRTEVSRFPGLTWSLGATFAFTDSFGATGRFLVNMLEGYNGDGEKSVVEGQLLFHVRFDASPLSTPMILPPLGGSI